MKTLTAPHTIIEKLSQDTYYFLRTSVLFVVYKVLMKPFLQLILGVQFSDSNAMETEEQFILVANHNSHADTMALMASVPTKSLANTASIAAGDYFGKNKLMSFFMRFLVNAKLIDRKNGGRDVIEQMDRSLKRGRSIIIFPEGSRGEPGVMQDFKKGVAILLQKNPSIPYIPVYLDNLDKIMPKGDPFIIPYCSNVLVGRAKRIRGGETLEEILETMRREITDLNNKRK